MNARLIALLVCGLTFLACAGGDSESARGSCRLDGLERKIENGESCSGKSAVVRLQFDNGFEVGSCSGAFISQKHVLTAAHCVTEGSEMVVALTPSEVRVTSGASSHVLGSVKKIHLFPGLQQELMNIAGEVGDTELEGQEAADLLIATVLRLGLSDLAVVELERPLPVPTIPVSVSRTPAIGDEMIIYGFGIRSAAEDSPVSTVVEGIVSVSQLGPKNIETISSDSSARGCDGDSGGPALAEVDGELRIVGVYSLGSSQCGEESHNIYVTTATPEVRAFLASNVPSESLR